MAVRKLLADDDAVSPVVAVILMVAVTVILAAVIGTFVLGIGAQVTSDTPQVSLQFDFDTVDDGNGTDVTEVTVTHRGGDQLAEDTLRMNAEGTDLTLDEPDYPMKAGDILVGTASSELDSGTPVRVIWQEPQGQGTAIIGESQVP